MCLLRFETANEIHRDENVQQSFPVYSVLEYCKDPVGCKVTSPTFFANFVIEIDWVGLKNNRGLFAWPIIQRPLLSSQWVVGLAQGVGRGGPIWQLEIGNTVA